MDQELPGRLERIGQQSTLLCAVALPVVAAVGLACLGIDRGDSPVASVSSLLYAWLTSGAVAAGWMCAALGLGWPVARLLAPAGVVRWLLQPGAGVGALLWVDHALGVAGLLSGAIGRAVGVGVLVVGCGLLGVQVWRTLAARPRLARTPGVVLLASASVAVLLVASASPPGVLWRSEAGGFDALSYHLPLVVEWGHDRLWPLNHNVYSYLPSYAEAGFLHVQALCGGRLVGGDGLGVLACQKLHVLQSLAAAVSVAGVAWRMAQRGGVGEAGCKVAGGLACAVVLSAPWVTVTGSLAYNEMAALCLCAAACLSAIGDGGAWQRGLGAGLLLGAAAACKPTFFFLGGPTVGLLLLSGVPLRSWGAAVCAGVLGGVLMLGPPLARNFAACGNPLFPLVTAAPLGPAHWSTEQAARFGRAHGRDGTVGEQAIRLLSMSAEVNPATGRPVSVDAQPRGVFHAQWALLLPVGLCAGVLLLLRGGLRVTGGVLIGGAVMACVFWVLATHGQSRFLIPLVLNAACAVGLLAGWVVGEGGALPAGRRLTLLLCCVVPLLASASGVRLFLMENGARPNAALTAGVSQFSGEGLAARFRLMSVEDRNMIEDAAPPTVYAAVTFGPEDRLLLVGDATPLYYLVPVIYSTVWDRSPVGPAMESHPDDPSAWTEAARRLGATYVLINVAEIDRYNRTYGFDPAVTVERLVRWVDALGGPIRTWETPDGTPVQVLLRLPPVAPVGPSKREIGA